MPRKITTLSTVERLKLANQLKILEKLDPDNAESYAEDRSIIEHGYSIQYDDVFSQIFEEMPEEECRYVYDVLDMYRELIQSFNALEDKEGMTLDDVTFQGFDGNNESKRHAFVEHLQEQRKWSETLTGGLNSHSMTTITKYPRMLAKYEPIKEDQRRKHKYNALTAAQIKEIISHD